MWQTAGRQATWLPLLISRVHLKLLYLLQKPGPHIYLATDVCSQRFPVLNQVQTGPVIQESSLGIKLMGRLPPTSTATGVSRTP